MARGGWGAEAEDHVVQRIRLLPGWKAVNVNHARLNTPGHDVVASDVAGRKLLVSVKSRSQGRDFAIGSSFVKHPIDVYVFVDMTGGRPIAVYLAGSATIIKLAMARHEKYQRDRGRPTDVLGSWSPKISEQILISMGTREAWEILELPTPTAWPVLTPKGLTQARRDAPNPRAT